MVALFGLMTLAFVGVMIVGTLWALGSLVRLAFWILFLPFKLLLLPFKLLFLPFLLLKWVLKGMTSLLLLPVMMAIAGVVTLLFLVSAIVSVVLPLLPFVFVGFALWAVVRMLRRPAATPVA